MSSSAIESDQTMHTATVSSQPRWPAVVAIFGLAGLTLTAYLSWSALTANPIAGCAAGDVFNCEHVFSSHWSKVGGIPVAVPAFGLYCVLLSALAFTRLSPLQQVQQAGWTGVTLCSIAAGLAGLWFSGLQMFALDYLCPWCLAAHTCGIILCGTLLWKQPLGTAKTSQLAALAVVAVSVMMSTQMLTPRAQQFIVERYKDVSLDKVQETTFAAPADNMTDALADSELFAPPDPVFDAPDDSVFEAPAAAETVSETANDTKQETSAGEAASASLLLLMAPRLSVLTHLLTGHAFDESDSDDADNSETSATAAKEEAPAAPKRRLIGVTGNRFRLDIKQWPLLGSPDAKYVFVEMFDYTCPHCRNTNRAVKGAFKHFGDDLAVIALPVPLDRKCNSAASGSGGMHRDSCEISRIAVGVWRIDPAKFHQLHDWIFERQRTAAATRRHAESLVGTAALNKELKYPTAGEYISKHVLLYQRVGAGSVPKLMFPKASMVGEVTSTQVLCRRIERELAD